MIEDHSTPDVESDAPDPMADWVPMQLTDAQRLEWAQEVVAELAPLEHEFVQELNNILTDEQHIERLKASQQGISFGLTGLPLFQHVMGAMRLTDEQKAALTSARRRLREVRDSIAPHVALLLDKQQKGQISDDAASPE